MTVETPMRRLKFGKPRPKLLDKRQAQADTRRIDREENAKVKARSGGQCEMVELRTTKPFWIVSTYDVRCKKRGAHIHHLLSGIGRRNVGDSILAEHKLHLCTNCHSEIHGHVLTPVSYHDRTVAAKVRWRKERA